MNSAKHINQIRDTPGIPLWQRNYYEHIIRNEKELHRIREYIFTNPSQWNKDKNNSVNIQNELFLESDKLRKKIGFSVKESRARYKMMMKAGKGSKKS